MPTQFRSQRKLHKGLIPKHESPFEIVRKVGKVPFELKLSPSMRVHLVLHASMLKPYHGNSTDSARAGSFRPSVTDTPSIEREIVEILDHRTIYWPKAKPYYEYLVRWSGQIGTSPPGSVSKT